MLMCPKSKKGRWILERQVAFFICSAKVLVLMMTARSVPTQASTCWRLHWGVLAWCLAACRASLCACGRCLHRPGTSQPGSTMWGWGDALHRCKRPNLLTEAGSPCDFSPSPSKSRYPLWGKKRLYDSAALRTQPGQWRQQWDFSKLESNLATRIYFLF